MHRTQRRQRLQLFRQQTGFTLVELVTTMILIAILSVVVLPRLLTSSNYSAFTLRDEFVAELRKVQLMAMNNSDRCYRLAVTPTGYQLTHFAGRTANACSGKVERTDAFQNFEGGATLSHIASGSGNFNIDFDTRGRGHLGSPLANCAGQCLNVIADETLVIAIESEGYIHEG